MAEFSKYKAFSVGRLLLHNNRKSNDGVIHSNESIDNARTVYNYHFKKGTVDDVQHRLEEVAVTKRNDAIVIGEMIVTLPKDVKEEDERDFFQAVYDFYCEDFGEENIINAVVHKDEKQPHIHIDFVPVIRGEPNFVSKRGKSAIEDWKEAHDGSPPTERLCCKDLITQKYLSQMHPRLSEYIKENLGYEVSILNGATINGNRTVLQLKADTLKKEIESMQNQKKHLGNELNEMFTIAKNHGIGERDIGLFPLMQKIADLENQNMVLKNLIARHGYTWKREELETMQAKKYVPAQSISVNVYDGSLVFAPIENNAVVVIELPNKISRDSPQKRLIENDLDLERQIKIVQSSSKQVLCRSSRTSDKIYLFIKTDDVQQTLQNLMLLEKQLKELDLKNRKVYMDKMETDNYDLARSILIQNKINALYFMNREQAEKNKTNDKTISQEMS